MRLHVDTPSINRPCQHPQQISAMDAKARGSHPPLDAAQSHAPQPFSPPGPALKEGKASTDRSQGIVQAQVPQDLHSIGPQGQARPDLAQLGIALEDRDPDALTL
jgi:hypothetical protein